MISAGEASGDAHAAHALIALRKRLAANGENVTAFGMGGTTLESAGCELIVDNRDLSVIGFVDVLLNYPRFLKRLSRLRDELRSRRPALLLIADYPDFNLKLAETARELDIPVLMYVAPQVWAWRAGRIPRIASRVSHMAVLFPFEVPIWTQAGLDTTCVGHPMVQTIDTHLSVAEARAQMGLAENSEVLALLPGSRPGEIKRLLPLMLETARHIVAVRPDCRFVLPRAPSIDAATIAELISEERESARAAGMQAADIKMLEPDQVASTTVMRAADVVLVASGTATLETGLVGTPMVVVYRVSAVNAALMRRLIKIPYLALVNIIAERGVVPEFIQEHATADAISVAVLTLLDSPDAREAMRTELQVIRQLLGDKDASEAVAKIMHELMHEFTKGLSEQPHAHLPR
jgi:lipid-A-disaccharide synthase